MLYSLRLFLFLINSDQPTILNWFDSTLNTKTTLGQDDPIYKLIASLSLFKNDLLQKVQDGLNLTDIENVIFFLIFVRFIILIFRYNLKTSTYITCIGIFAGYLWYRHLIDIVTMYSQLLIKFPYWRKLGVSAIELQRSSVALAKTDMQLGSNVHWYNPGKLFYYAFTKGIIHTDPDSGLRYYIDPISMIISNLNETNKARILPYYYQVYNVIIPYLVETIGEFWQQLSGIVAYAMLTRVGKRYCPYLVRWHWTFLLIMGFLEQVMIFFIFRVEYFQQNVLEPNLVFNVATQASGSRAVTLSATDPNLLFQFNALSIVLLVCISVHIGSIFFGLLHAIYGQYFYIPLFVETTELHIGPRPKNSIYSGGNTAWQDEKQANIYRKFPKLWYGWFGNGTKTNWITGPVQTFFRKSVQKVIRLFKK
uniref:Uncharacterized protein n=1 Tax=Pseudo-nitzschia multiseries TaxID=37319 RepID=A0A0K1DCP8_PSEMU|nr:hypothetical protein [Pseudo-nitzschia multiseries]AKT26118.1 hypothetical protein [Pseudo-nitzschia multiseries]UBA15522.1 hypothetical protein Ycf90 [Pseudo-nitzschia multiseries]